MEHSHREEFSQGVSPTTRLPKAAASTHQGMGAGAEGGQRPEDTTAIPGLSWATWEPAPGKVAIL